MDLFWRRGYHATSTKELADHMGVNPYSLFAEFESKQGLYEAALQLYDLEVVGRHFRALEAPEAGIRELVGVVEFFAGASGSAAEKGCFLTNAAVERGPEDNASRKQVHAYVARIQRAIQGALENAKNRGEIRPEVSCEDHSHMLAATLIGFWVMKRARLPREMTVNAARAICRDLERLRP
jgi:TetR/AcrR family transcriptional repressor of nem operon